MSHFYGTLSGQAGAATRCGSRQSGLVVVAASWQGCITVRLWCDAEGRDHFQVNQERWRGAGLQEFIEAGHLGRSTKKE